MIIAIALLINSLKIKEKHFKLDDEIKANLKPFFITVAAIIVYFILWKLITFFPATMLFVLFRPLRTHQYSFFLLTL